MSDSDLRSLGTATPIATPGLLFSESLTPMELTAWLTQELESKGLTLEESQRQSLLSKYITGTCSLFSTNFMASGRTWFAWTEISLEGGLLQDHLRCTTNCEHPQD